ncbi:MAG: TIGR03960 family B12-binding radical SAM protein [Dehalococcoidia bacterium]|nr:MAG: TIGR03960 family B12-binding radical SAM protein [Dehalococcoidia bacterium]
MSIPDSIFHQVSRPARYTGNEWNSIIKPWDSAILRVALCYPDSYEVGMSNLALPILYESLNSFPGVLAERVFAPWADMEQALRASGQHLFSLESKHSLSEFDVVGFSLGYELTYTNVLAVLDLGGIPVLRRDRNSLHPVIIAGGSCTVNPEPMSDFIDLFFVGEAEEGLSDLRDGLLAHGHDRVSLLKSAARIPGVYVPSLYEPRYREDGAFFVLEPQDGDVPPVISRRIVETLPPPPTRPVVPFLEAVHDYGSIEIQRGCTRGCRFCQAGMVYRPIRTRDRQQIRDACEQLAGNCGYSELSLLSLSSSDYPQIEELVADLAPLCRRENISLSLPSLRLGPESVRLLEALPGRRGSSFTFAPEAGTERLRRAINKNVTEEDIFTTLDALREGGWTKLKLYFMIGLPTETEEDVVGISTLVRRIAAFDPALRLNVGVSLLVPKPHTPFQSDGQDDSRLVDTKVGLLKRGLRAERVKLSWPDARVSQLEAALSRGDRRLGRVILRAWELGSRFDAWGECFTFDNWQEAFASCGLRIEDFSNRAREPGEPLPWAHIDTGVSQQYLAAEHDRMMQGQVTMDCRVENCNACGLHTRVDGCPQAARATS